MFRGPGKVNDRVFFPLDEAVLLNRDRALKIARDQGRNSLCQWRFRDRYEVSEGFADRLLTFRVGRRAVMHDAIASSEAISDDRAQHALEHRQEGQR
jgi:hypothetical protein